MITAVDLIIGKIIEAAIQEGKGELKGVPSSQIVPYDPSKETDDSNLNDQVTTVSKKKVQNFLGSKIGEYGGRLSCS